MPLANWPDEPSESITEVIELNLLNECINSSSGNRTSSPRIHPSIESYVHNCPIRLYDTATHKIVSRYDFTAQILSNVREYLETKALNGQKREIFDWVDEEDTLFFHIRLSGKYAILSHRWEDDELTFEDLADEDLASKKKGYIKFKRFYEIANQHGCRYVWIDTACINKSSSSELDESIRSMFSWYRNAYVCFVYLTTQPGNLRDDLWFTRGWTLQELLAPRRLKFFWGDWSEYEEGTRFDIRRADSDLHDIPANRLSRQHHYDATLVAGHDAAFASTEDDIEAERGEITLTDDAAKSATESSALLEAISDITGINPQSLKQYKPSPNNACSAFSWVSRRITTRPEDTAYCLIALLDIRLPITYGEGPESAFYRVQIECAMLTEVRDLFSWVGRPSRWNSMFAESPASYKELEGHIISDYLFSTSQQYMSASPPDQSFTLTNCGLRIMITLHDLQYEFFYLKSGEFRPGRRGARTPLLIDMSFQVIEPSDTKVRLGWVGPQPSKDEVETSWKIGVLGGFSGTDTASAILLQTVEDRSPKRYRRLTSVIFEKLPPRSRLTSPANPPKLVFIE